MPCAERSKKTAMTANHSSKDFGASRQTDSKLSEAKHRIVPAGPLTDCIGTYIGSYFAVLHT